MGKCNKTLQCPPLFSCDYVGLYSLPRTELVADHQYCSLDTERFVNNGEYDIIDRSDETAVGTFVDDARIDYDKLQPCVTAFGNKSGIQCGEQCRANAEWCTGVPAVCMFGDVKINTNNKQLCRNFTFWGNIGCDEYYEDGRVSRRGKRCIGASQHCYFPWYLQNYGSLAHTSKCSDKSDEIFPIGSKCPQNSKYLEIHNNFFCNNSVNTGVGILQYLEICTNPQGWLGAQTKEDYLDPHNCWSSCACPGPECKACTNPDYFQCHQSGQCIHPSLLCDGHPQCTNAEDENYDTCRKEYLRNHIVTHYGSLKCASAMYPQMTTVATACNGIQECADRQDEDRCKEGSLSTTILVATSLFFMIFYLTLKLAPKCYLIWKGGEEPNFTEINGPTLEFLLERYESNHKDLAVINQVNYYMFHVISTQTIEKIVETCKMFYDSEASIHKNNKADIFCCMHNKLDPLICKAIIESKFPGLTQKTINKIERVAKRSFITNFLNMLTVNERISKVFHVFKKIIVLQFYYIDMFKDSFLAITIMVAAGGFSTVWQFPTNFTSVVVLSFFASILVPLLMSSIHLAISHPFLIFDVMKIKRRSRLLAMVFCFLLTLLNPILLLNAYEIVQEKARILVKRNNFDMGVIDLLKKCRKIKIHLVDFLRIELGRLIAIIFC